MKKIIICFLFFFFLFSLQANAQFEEKMEDYSPTATQWLHDAVGDAGKTAIKAVYLVHCKKTSMKGTGFLLKGGPVITNEHVLRGCDSSDIIIISSQGNQFQIREIKVDNQRDLAALTPSQQLTDGLLLGNEAGISVGKMVWTWGFPLGYNGPAPLLSVGYLSGFKAYKKNQNSNDLIKHLVVNGAFNSGNSGGPLFRSNSDRVIGVVANKALPLFTPFVKLAVEAFAKNSAGVNFSGTDDKGKPITMSESQVVAEVVKSLREMSQVMIGEAISLSELRAFLKDKNIREPK